MCPSETSYVKGELDQCLLTQGQTRETNFERFCRVLVQTFIKTHWHELFAKIAISFCRHWMWSIFWCLTLWKLGVTFWRIGWSAHLLTHQGTGEDLQFGSTCFTVGISLTTVITTLFPLHNMNEALSNFDMVLIIWKCFPSIYEHNWWQIAQVKTKSSVSRKLWVFSPNWKGKTTLSK